LSFEERLRFLLLRWRPPLSNEGIEEIAKEITKLHEEHLQKQGEG